MIVPHEVLSGLNGVERALSPFCHVPLPKVSYRRVIDYRQGSSLREGIFEMCVF
ncbi:MAG: hypothetical protein JRI40_02900 [Deltaproteobacteria bacterium]|nr:hypothetical protein [Deltaproteobacteria bacterium]